MEGRTWCVSGALRDSALGFIATARSDGILVLDEIGMCDPRVIGETVHMLAAPADASIDAIKAELDFIDLQLKRKSG